MITDQSSIAEKEGIYDLLPFILKPWNIARFEKGQVVIGDRRQYPFKKAFVSCDTVDEVAQAIKDMVTQGSGPWMSAANALLLVADGKAHEKKRLQKAREVLVATRPTNTAMARRLDRILAETFKSMDAGESAANSIANSLNSMMADIYDSYTLRAKYANSLIDKNDGILTHCFAEAGFILAMAMAYRDGKNICVFTPETRPFLQGAKLTAPSLYELGIEVRLITDNMPASIMSQGHIQKFMTAADLITLDGYVVNKVGTFQSAIAAHYHQIPYYAFAWGVDENSATHESITIEQRDPTEVRTVLGQPITLADIKACYPAFDITPPQLVSGVISVEGVLSADDLAGRRKL
ncbi:MAG TPA: S-methyl-5-thioribose-1-phosphate isomerase [Aeromonadales bacterium]|nr:S-methyl-5-thioribose-1-phosphate isomerase [Aeromonadales bacterium]